MGGGRGFGLAFHGFTQRTEPQFAAMSEISRMFPESQGFLMG
jgi:hypothetical protein